MKIGNEPMAIIEARETYFVNFVIISQTIMDRKEIKGAIAINTPNVVATPFPPLNFR